jgi:hypothetical protein
MVVRKGSVINPEAKEGCFALLGTLKYVRVALILAIHGSKSPHKAKHTSLVSGFNTPPFRTTTYNFCYSQIK